jgi:hypothetical protein
MKQFSQSNPPSQEEYLQAIAEFDARTREFIELGAYVTRKTFGSDVTGGTAKKEVNFAKIVKASKQTLAAAFKELGMDGELGTEHVDIHEDTDALGISGWNGTQTAPPDNLTLPVTAIGNNTTLG